MTSPLPPLYAYATRPHYGRHIEPVAQALKARGHTVTLLQPGRTPPIGEHVLVASGTDVTALGKRKLIYVEHGAGQSYDGDPDSRGKRGYPGGDGMGDVVLFLCPNQSVADRWEARYPGIATAVIGSPALDSWHSVPPVPAMPRIAFTFHWPSRHSVEAGTAWPVFQRYIEERVLPLALLNGWSVVGHEHPRWQNQLRDSWRQMGVPVVSYETVMDTATLLVADNTSMLPEFASTGRPVLWLSSPEWRRDVDHGGRFWDWPKGQIECSNPFDIANDLKLALDDTPDVQAARQKMVESIYAFTDGQAAERGADAIEALLG